VPLEAGRVIVEEGAHVRVRDCSLRLERAQMGKVNPHAHWVTGLERERGRQRGDRRLAGTQRHQGAPEERMARREVRGELERLAREIGRGRKIGLVEGALGIGIAPVGQEIARGAEGRERGHGPGMRDGSREVNRAGAAASRREPRHSRVEAFHRDRAAGAGHEGAAARDLLPAAGAVIDRL
jgi:hypothetical protein